MITRAVAHALEQAYAQHDAALVRVANAECEVSSADAKVDAAKQEALLAQRNLDSQNATARRFVKAAIAAAKAADQN